MERSSHLLRSFPRRYASFRCSILEKLERANNLLQEHGISVVSGDLSLVRDRNGAVYKIEKYCYSKPRNLITEGTEGTAETGTCLSAPSPPETKEENNKFRFRVGAVCSARGV